MVLFGAAEPLYKPGYWLDVVFHQVRSTTLTVQADIPVPCVVRSSFLIFFPL